ncbi:type VII secretion protein EssB [Microbacterium resistens]|uniref:Type VII secretion protein EssB n=1 Tax=Microbacterium resistens TaxID=156977 RepID=A0ABU1S7C7_9MICO|nr:type VII secretion protein EssB [Microbacterium resistens]MDR6865512.1 type VII secretion protein EssB [Microbacterium resistens]
MRIVVDGTALELDPGHDALRVGVEQNGFDGSCLDVIARYVDTQETDTGIVLGYGLAEGEISFREAMSRTRTRLDRLLLAQSLVACSRHRGGFMVPLIHPDNVYLNGGLLRVVHFGLEGMLAPMAFDEVRFLASLQAMVLQVFRPKLTFEQLLDGASALRDKFSTAVRQTATVEELFAYVDAQLRTEQSDVLATKVSLSRRRYSLYRTLGALGLVVALAAGAFAWQTGSQNRLQTAVVAAQARFLASDYAGTLTELDAHTSASLPASAKYVLAVSSINLHDLTTTQKQTILNTISEKSDDVTLNYWIAMGRGEFEQALDYAKNLGDDQLTLLAYTDLYQATKIDAQMPGGKKQELLDEYAKAIDELTAKLGGTSGTAARE